MILLNMGLYITILLGRALQRLFFGQLRALEVEHLYERSWFAVTETCLAMTIFRDEFDIRFIILFGLLLLVKIFHWIVQDRVEFMEQAPNPSVGWHVRMQTITAILAAIDLAMIVYAVQYTRTRGPSMMIIFGFEYTILLSLVLSTFVKYLLHSYDLRRNRPWEEKSIYIFYVDLMHDFEKLVTYFCFFGIVVYYYSLPLHIVRDLYMTLRSFIHRCRDLIQYRRATANMNERYPDATPEELSATDRVCIICREEMDIAGDNVGQAAPVNNGQPRARAGGRGPAAGGPRPIAHPDTPKKLYCGHIFHFHCLRSWLERQQSCPTCRRSVLEQPSAAAAQQAAGRPPAGGAPGNAVNDFQAFWQQHQQLFAGGVLHAAPGVNTPGPSIQPQANGGATAAGPIHTLVGESQNLPTSSIPDGMMFPITLTPLIPLTGAHSGQPQTIPPVLDHLSDEQLRSMEGRSREAMMERIRALQNIQHQLTGVITQLMQISQIIPPSAATPGAESGSGIGASRSGYDDGAGVNAGAGSSSSSSAAKEETVDRKGKGVAQES
ncbi:hypothetical protein SpCBS45565_g04588 [Spizellomyces sp. 'palustris']|nr:hypothetical protein SpCBS45565_g04588 [Spizellomyces sp. 'palustris']